MAGVPPKPPLADHWIAATFTPTGTWKVTAPTERMPGLRLKLPLLKLV